MVLNTIMPLLLVAAGGVIGILSNYLTQVFQSKRERKSISSAFAGEIKAILYIVEKRNYINLFKADIEEIKEGKAVGSSISISSSYFSVYIGNVGKLGLLNAPLPEELATFYTLAMSVLEDIKVISDPKCTWNNKEEQLWYYEELLALFIEADELGRRILKRLGNESIAVKDKSQS
ncbi:MAG TPA: hypothetical protein VJ302_16745 [Blastocatellia bacterium]|nr:hypothetical protein [Blastocatellia bacterium]